MRQSDVVEQYTDHIIDNLYELSKEELIEVWCNLNDYHWDKRIGKQPADWKYLPKKNRTLIQKWKRPVTKFDFIEPISDKIEEFVGKKALLKYWNTTYNNMTDDEFERMWRKDLIEIEKQAFADYKEDFQ